MSKLHSTNCFCNFFFSVISVLHQSIFFYNHYLISITPPYVTQPKQIRPQLVSRWQASYFAPRGSPLLSHSHLETLSDASVASSKLPSHGTVSSIRASRFVDSGDRLSVLAQQNETSGPSTCTSWQSLAVVLQHWLRA